MNSLRDLLVGIAARGETITYPALRQELQLEGDLVPALRALAESEDEAGRGLLTAVVIRPDTGRPGTGWFRLASARGRDVSDADRAWQLERDLLQKVHGGR
jgi:hypothetical protein